MPRFPPDKEFEAATAMHAVLDRLGAGPEDQALGQPANGGDLLFLEACLARGTRCRVMLPFDEAQFIRRSVLLASGGERSRERYYAV